MRTSISERNLLFGILAVQMDFISRDALVEAMQAWLLNKSRPLDELLVEKGWLSEARRQMLAPLVEEHIRQHGDDPQKSLAALSSVASIQESLLAIKDPQIEQTLAHLTPFDLDVTNPFASATTGAERELVRSNRAQGASRFRIIRPHARGGLGEVYLAHDEELNRDVALKEIQSGHASDVEARDRFVREAQITAHLEHPGIIPVYGLGYYGDGRPFYAMRFIQGDSLKEAIDRFQMTAYPDDGQRSLALHQLLRRFVDVCNAIQFAHHRGVLHRDLKPGNIMLGKYGETMVVDWGLAKPLGHVSTPHAGNETVVSVATTSDSSKTMPGSAIGTPAYMSPEQARGELDKLGPATDVYGLGATFYAILTGQAPFAGTSVAEITEKVSTGRFSPPRHVNWLTPVMLEAICLKAMALNPGDRYSSPAALAADVEAWMANQSVPGLITSRRDRAKQWYQRHLLTASLFGLMAAIALVVVPIGVTIGLKYPSSISVIVGAFTTFNATFMLLLFLVGRLRWETNRRRAGPRVFQCQAFTMLPISVHEEATKTAKRYSIASSLASLSQLTLDAKRQRRPEAFTRWFIPTLSLTFLVGMYFVVKTPTWLSFLPAWVMLPALMFVSPRHRADVHLAGILVPMSFIPWNAMQWCNWQGSVEGVADIGIVLERQSKRSAWLLRIRIDPSEYRIFEALLQRARHSLSGGANEESPISGQRDSAW